MAMSLAVTLHVLFVTIWVGGMFFAYQCLRPVVAAQLEPPFRLRLWVGVFGRFFPWVWGAVFTVLLSGLWIIFFVYGGFKELAPHIHIMFTLGLIMMGIFAFAFFTPFRLLKTAVAAENWPEGGKQLNRIRRLVGINLGIGLITIAIATGGRYLSL